MHGKPLLELELRPTEAPACATPGASVFVLLPALDDLLNAPGFATRGAILLSRPARAARFAPTALAGHLLH